MGMLVPTRTKVAILAVPGIALVLFLFVPSDSKEKNTQPLAYNHKVHVEKAELKCTECHLYAEQKASASIPTLEVCRNCHSEEPLSESPEEQKLIQYIAEGKEIPWKRIYRVPDHVYFSHRRHVVGGELECKVCHGDVAEFTKPVSSPVVPVTMENCMACHKKRKVTNDCLACHR
jgi:hypothetical protein